MYSIKVEVPDENNPVIDRSMSSNKVSELIPTAIELCKAKFAMVNPIALYMGHNVWRIFDVDKPRDYVKLSIIKIGD